MSKPAASISLDLDNLWAYKMARGDSDWQDFPSYLDIAVPRILRVLEQLDLRVTFFIVGQDAALKKNHRSLQAIVSAGHEIANHSFSHHPGFSAYDESQLLEEVIRAERFIEEVMGVRPVGWRSPAFGSSQHLTSMLFERGYIYDASSFPTFLGPLARIFYFLTAGLNKQQRQSRTDLYGGWSAGFKPLKPYQLQHNSQKRLLEIPITVMPLVRTPIHASYLHYLAKFSERLSRVYFGLALKMCSVSGIGPSFLLHPTDFLGVDDIPELSWFPAMDLESDVKLGRLIHFLGMLKNRYQMLPMQAYVNSLELGV